MTGPEFDHVADRLGISRRELCRRLGIASNSGIAYANARAPIPRYVPLACAALIHGLAPMGSTMEDA